MGVGAVVGSLQSGALSYYRPPDVRVVNLDGVVAGRAARALRESRLGSYLEERSVTRFADWEIQAGILERRAGQPIRLEEIARASPPQGPMHRMTLYRVSLPAGGGGTHADRGDRFPADRAGRAPP